MSDSGTVQVIEVLLFLQSQTIVLIKVIEKRLHRSSYSMNFDSSRSGQK